MPDDSWDPPKREQIPLLREDKIAIFWVLAGFEGLLRAEVVDLDWLRGCSAFNWVSKHEEAPFILATHIEGLIAALRKDLGDY